MAGVAAVGPTSIIEDVSGRLRRTAMALRDVAASLPDEQTRKRQLSYADSIDDCANLLHRLVCDGDLELAREVAKTGRGLLRRIAPWAAGATMAIGAATATGYGSSIGGHLGDATWEHLTNVAIEAHAGLDELNERFDAALQASEIHEPLTEAPAVRPGPTGPPSGGPGFGGRVPAPGASSTASSPPVDASVAPLAVDAAASAELASPASLPNDDLIVGMAPARAPGQPAAYARNIGAPSARLFPSSLAPELVPDIVAELEQLEREWAEIDATHGLRLGIAHPVPLDVPVTSRLALRNRLTQLPRFAEELSARADTWGGIDTDEGPLKRRLARLADAARSAIAELESRAP